MIEAKELRVGNYFKWSEFASMGVGVDIITKENHYIYEGFKEPIPLTEEWLLKLGFEYVSIYDSYIKQTGQREFILRKRDFVLCDIDIRVQPKYVHQLQNLYFALTGEELTITE